jgi:hypothetical protein
MSGAHERAARHTKADWALVEIALFSDPASITAGAAVCAHSWRKPSWMKSLFCALLQIFGCSGCRSSADL